ncbi:MAG: trypsin-like peptidase domain-containing protein [Planctomycetes bacterium]|nr:trypsin-like peptidase domain-containing protein [Planctomycetota bacterium]
MRRIALAVLFLVSVAAAPRGQEALDLQDIIFLVESGTSEQEIVDTVRRQRIRFRLDEAAEEQLRKKGATDRVIAVIRHVQLIDDVVAMKIAGKDEIEIIRAIAERGIVLEMDASDKLYLHKKRLSADVINALMGNFTFREFKTHEHPGGFFRVQHPDGWNPLEEYEDEKIIVAFTPQSKTTTRAVEVGFRIEIAVCGSKSPHSYMPLETVNQLRMRMLEADAKESGAFFQRGAEPRTMKVLGIPAFLNEYQYGLGEKKIRRHAILLFYNGVEYWVAYDAPTASFDAQHPTFEKMLLTFNPAPGELGRQVRKPSADPQQMLERYRESVVQVEALGTENGRVMDGGAGTGWFIRRDGYILTNHHVVWCDRLNRFADRLLIKWDASLRREPVEAKLIDAVRLDNPKVDIALLKAKGSNFLPMPVTRVNPANKYVKEQDKVLALGYPGIVEDGKVVPLTLTSTRGTLSKFNLRPDYKVETVIIDAVLQHGNSGGPCVDMETHSVIGLNTFFPSRENEMTETFGGVIPVDAAFEFFPEIVCYPESVDAKFGAADYLALAGQFLAQGLTKPALRQIGRAFAKKMNVPMSGSWGESLKTIDDAIARKPEFPEGFALTGDLLAVFGLEELAKTCYEIAIEQDGKNVRALMGLAGVDREQAVECFTRVIAIRPKDHRAYLCRARAHLKANKLDEAEADAKRACECCGDLYVEPYCLYGEILYTRKRYDEGATKYEKAVQIDPRNVSARFGLVDFFVLQGRHDEAVQAVNQMAADGARDIEWMRRSGDVCWNIAERHREAGDEEKAGACRESAYGYYDKTVNLYEEWNRTPDKNTLLRYAGYAREVKKDVNTALKWFVALTRTLIAVEKGKRANDPDLETVYVNLGHIFRGFNREAHAGGFFQATLNLGARTPAGKQARQLLKGNRVPLKLADIEMVLTKTNLSHYAVADIVSASPLAFQLSGQDAQVLLNRGWPEVVLQAMLKGGQKQTTTVRGQKEIYEEWAEKDARIVQEAKKIAWDKRNAEFEKYFKAHDKKDYKTSIPGFKKIFYLCTQKDRPLAATAAYNVCCGYSLLGQTDEALDWFELCFYWGFFEDQRDMVAHCTKDTDLDNIRGEERFAKVMEAAKKIKKKGPDESQTNNGGSLGVDLEDLSDEDRQDAGLKAGVGVMIVDVVKGGPAEKLGVQAGDILVKLDDDVMGSARKAKEWIKKRSPGTKIKVVLVREKEFLQGEATLGSE